MLPEKYRRLWKRRLRRRPLLPFLLLATGCLDAVSVVLLASSRTTWAHWSESMALGFLSSQLHLLAIWTAWYFRHWAIRALVTLAYCVVFAYLLDRSSRSSGNIYAHMLVTSIMCATGSLVISAVVRRVQRYLHKTSTSLLIKTRFSVADILAAMSFASVSLFVLLPAWREVASSRLLGLIMVLASIEIGVTMCCLLLAMASKELKPVLIILGLLGTLVTTLSLGHELIATFLAFTVPQLAWLFGLQVRPKGRVVSKATSQQIESQSIDATV